MYNGACVTAYHVHVSSVDVGTPCLMEIQCISLTAHKVLFTSSFAKNVITAYFRFGKVDTYTLFSNTIHEKIYAQVKQTWSNTGVHDEMRYDVTSKLEMTDEKKFGGCWPVG